MNIRLYLSKQGYNKKPDKSAGIIKIINSYELVDIEIEDLYKKLSNGHFIHHECGYSQSANGSSFYTFKKTLLKQAQIMQIDFDYKLKDTKSTGEIVEKHYEANEMPDWTIDLLSNLKYKNSLGQEIDISPTFWMESFSAHKNTDSKIVGNNIHMFYVFNDPIYNVYDYENVAITIIYAVYTALKANGYEIPLEKERCPFDPVSLDMFQGIWGSYDKKHHYNGNTYFWDEIISSYDPSFKNIIFQVSKDETDEATDEEIERTINAYSTVESLDDIDISKSQYIKYKKYFGHTEGFHIISVLKHEYSKIEEQVNSKQSLCYQVCRKLLLGHCNDFFNENENDFYHEYKRCKAYKKKGSNEAAYMSHVIKLIGDTGAIPLIEYKQPEEKNDNIIKLSKTEYLSDKKDEIISKMIIDDKTLNFIIANPGLGKTVFAKSLEGNTLIIELFNSIIRSEEKFPSYENSGDPNDFTKFFGDKYIKHDNITRLNVCSANKFVSWVKSNDCDRYGIENQLLEGQCLFDNIILDESHLLCLSNYRYNIMGETVEYIKKLKEEYPATNIILMTGTPFGEHYIFNNLNTIEIKAEPRYTKKFYMIQTTSIVGYMQELIKSSLENGLRIFIPIDSENWFDTFIESLIKEGIITKDKTYYFNQPKNEEEIEINILNTKLIGDIKILGTSSYMSVGIDLEDWSTEFVTIIPSGGSNSGNFSGIEVEQFANRHRKQNLYVYYVISNNENNNNSPILSMSCRALLNIKNDLLKSMYRTNPIIIKMPQYLTANESDELVVNEDMYNVYVYYKDMIPIISHPKTVYDYMERKGWDCKWDFVDNVNRGIDTKEHRDIIKANGVEEFITLLNVWSESNYPIIKVKESIQPNFEIIQHKDNNTLFNVKSIEVGFTNYYAKNVLLGKFLNIREYLTGVGTYCLIRDAYDNGKINMAFIDRNLLAIKIINTYTKSGLWNDIYNKLSEFYDEYSTIGIYKENKKKYEVQRDIIIQDIWDNLASRVTDDTLVLALENNYKNVTDNIIDCFMDGIKLICTMYLEKKTITMKINKKTQRMTYYSWNSNALSKYEVRKDKQ